MNDECIIEHLADGTHACRTHQSIGGALCHHAAAALQGRVTKLQTEAFDWQEQWKITSSRLFQAEDRVRELEGPFLISCPWCGSNLESSNRVSQIHHLIECGDKQNGRAEQAVGRASELWSAAKSILLEDYGNDPSKLEALVGRAIRIMEGINGRST